MDKLKKSEKIKNFLGNQIKTYEKNVYLCAIYVIYMQSLLKTVFSVSGGFYDIIPAVIDHTRYLQLPNVSLHSLFIESPSQPTQHHYTA